MHFRSLRSYDLNSFWYRLYEFFLPTQAKGKSQREQTKICSKGNTQTYVLVRNNLFLFIISYNSVMAHQQKLYNHGYTVIFRCTLTKTSVTVICGSIDLTFDSVNVHQNIPLTSVSDSVLVEST